MKTLAIAAALLLSACASAAAQTEAPEPGHFDYGALIGPPPAPGSDAENAERAAMRVAPSPERIAQADADRAFSPWSAFAPVLGENFTAENFPHTEALFAALLPALAQSSNAAKDTYARPRPFLEDASITRCGTPDQRTAESAAYPSGHAMAGWSWALLLAELSPSRAEAILTRGRDYGESRTVCGLHFPSDVEASRTLAAAVVAMLHGDAEFRAKLDAARAELHAAGLH